MEEYMVGRICLNCGESCEKEYETVFVQGQEFCVCCNSNIDISYNEEGNKAEFLDEASDRNNAFIDFFNESGLLKST